MTSVEIVFTLSLVALAWQTFKRYEAESTINLSHEECEANTQNFGKQAEHAGRAAALTEAHHKLIHALDSNGVPYHVAIGRYLDDLRDEAKRQIEEARALGADIVEVRSDDG